MAPIITVDKIGKRYEIGAREEGYSTLRESIVSLVRSPLKRFRRRGSNNADARVWALKDVTFQVQPGEVLGIIGRNGAGKSTLLKVLSRITKPTTGAVDCTGALPVCWKWAPGSIPS